MLRLLRIRNLAVIEAVDVEFGAGFTVLTGETGAGKSILIEAVGLLLGARASSDLVRTGEHQATIEAVFEDAPDGAPPRTLVVRREISTQGRSRSFIDGAVATSGALRELSGRLVELHGQHEHQALLDPATHLPLLDSYAGLDDDAARVAAAWESLRSLRDQLDRSRMDARERAARLELIAFQLGEIEKTAPKAGEDDELAALKQVLASAERVRRLCDESYASLYESDGAVLAGLGGVWKRVGELASIDPQFSPYLDARDAIKAQLEDLAFFLRRYREDVDASPARLQEVEDRLAALERLKRKYGPALEDAMARAAALRRERDLLTGDGQTAVDLERSVGEASEAFLVAARRLSRRRRDAAIPFASGIESLLGDLAMGETRFEVRFNDRELPPDAWSERGVDRAEFYVSTNVGEDLRPLARIVSGGELSRMMLALKTMSAASGGGGIAAPGAAPKTLIFDEVDAGIGGRVAEVVGAKLRQLGQTFQVLCITHLPQIAARGTAQYRIEKHVRGGRTVTRVDRLDEAERLAEIARMIGGTGAGVLATARELLAATEMPAHSGTAKGKQKAKGESESRWRKST